MAENNMESKGQRNRVPNLKPSGGKPKFSFYWIYGILILGFLALQMYGWDNVSPKEIGLGKVKSMLEEGKIKKMIVYNKEFAEIWVKDSVKEEDKSKGMFGSSNPNFIYKLGSLESFEKSVEESQAALPESERVDISFDTRSDWSSGVFSTLIWIAVMFGMWFLLMRMMGRGSGGGNGGLFSVGKSKAQLYDSNKQVNVTFNDVAGLEEAKVEIMEIVDFLKNPKKYTDLGGKIPKGALLVGPPGTGKTLLAKAVAGEAKVPFFSMSGSDFVEMFVGVGASRVRDLFKQAKEKSPCIVFIDEVDAIGRARGGNKMMGGNDERENTLNQLLTEMDGFAPNQGVIVLAATNRAEILDKALLRAGRFDRQIYVDLPDIEGRKEIFKVHLRGLKLDDTADVNFLSKQTPGFSGADIANVCNEAALIAARGNKSLIGKQDFLDAIDRIVGGLEKKNKVMTIEEKRTIAMHEAGHATISWLTEFSHPLIKVSIVPRGKALGAAWYLPEERQITTFKQMYDEMTSLLGGRASEWVNFKEVSTGALNDLERATKMAYSMIVYFGLNKEIGNISYYDSSGQNEFGFQRPYSESTAEKIDMEVKALVESAFMRAVEILESNKDGLVKLGELLLDKEVIYRDDMVDIFGKRTFKKDVEDEAKELAENAQIAELVSVDEEEAK